MFPFQCIFPDASNVCGYYYLIPYDSSMNVIFFSAAWIGTFNCTFISMLSYFIDKRIYFLTRFLFDLVKLEM